MIIGKQTLECVVYKITNIINSREYIGVSSKFKKRINAHKNTPPPKMIPDVKDFDFEGFFDIEIIFQGTEDECYTLEEKLVPEDKSKRPYYNTNKGGRVGWVGSEAPKGEEANAALITNQEAYEIRCLYNWADGYDMIYLGNLYGLSASAVSSVTRGKSYTEVLGPRVIVPKFGENSASSKFSDADIVNIRISFSQGESSRSLANMYKTSTTYINQIITGDSRKKQGGPLQKKDRHYGEKHPNATFTNELVLYLRHEINELGRTIPELSKETGFGVEAIRNATNEKGWKHLDGKIRISNHDQKGEHNGRSKVEESDVLSIRNRGYKGESALEISFDYAISESALVRILKGERWDELGGKLAGKDYTLQKRKKVYLDKTKIEEIRIRCMNTTEYYSDIGKDYRVDGSCISETCRGLRFHDEPGPILGPNGDYQKREEGANV